MELWSSESTSSTPRTSMAGAASKATPSRFWGAGLHREAAAGTRWAWPPRYSIPLNARPTWPSPNTDRRALSAYKIRKHCEGSLKRLQTDHIDLYQMHHIDRDCPWDETWQAFGQLGNQGKVVYVGSSNFAGWDIATACQEASKCGLAGLSSEQSIYHLNNRIVELEVIPACRYYGLGLIPWSPLGGGL